jgi:hypothetical protein
MFNLLAIARPIPMCEQDYYVHQLVTMLGKEGEKSAILDLCAEAELLHIEGQKVTGGMQK